MPWSRGCRRRIEGLGLGWWSTAVLALNCAGGRERAGLDWRCCVLHMWHRERKWFPFGEQNRSGR